jgi:hypothetical protein
MCSKRIYGTPFICKAKNFETTNWIYFTSILLNRLEGVILSLKCEICSCNFLILFTVTIVILSRWKEINSKNLMELFLTKWNVRYHFILTPPNDVINVLQWNWLICEIYTATYLKFKMITLWPKVIRIRRIQHELLSSSDIYCKHMTLMLEDKMKKIILWKVR